MPAIQMPGARQMISELWRRNRGPAIAIAFLYAVAYAATAMLAFGSYIAALELESSSVVLAAVVGVAGTALGLEGARRLYLPGRSPVYRLLYRRWGRLYGCDG